MERDEPAIGPIEQFVVDDTDPLLDSAATRRDLRNLANRIDSQFVQLDARLSRQIMQLDTRLSGQILQLDTKIDALNQKIEITNLSLLESIESLATRGNREFIGVLIGFIGMIIAIVVVR